MTHSTPHEAPSVSSSPSEMDGSARTLGLGGATGIGVGAIVGGGILALAGVAFAVTGPSALLAFALNGVIALLTALSFAEMAASFPESGGTYTFAKKVLSVEAAFMVGWVVWFASIVAAVLYALGFAAYGVMLIEELAALVGATAPVWLAGRAGELLLALGATGFYVVGLVRRSGGGGQWATVGKVAVFAVLVVAGLWVLGSRSLAPEGGVSSWSGNLSPFFPAGVSGLVLAMGYTFIALQGFDLIAAVGGEVKRPERTIPRAMVLSLGIALAVYLPLLLVIATVGVPEGTTIGELSAENPETVVALAARNFLGETGYWLVLVAAVLSMLSALQANLLASSRVARAMALDRNLPGALARLHERLGTPVPAVVVTGLAVGVVLMVVPDLAAAGAVSSLIFLLSFALAHLTSILARRRGDGSEPPFRVPGFPLVPAVGGLACGALAVFQGVAVPAAGALAGAWLLVGGGLFFVLFARRARVVDASAEALDPALMRLRGRSPLVLAPIANPARAEALVGVASALAPPVVGEVLLLTVVRPPEVWESGVVPAQLVDAQDVLRESLAASFAASLAPEALTTVSEDPWDEIARVAQIHGCESLVVGLGQLSEELVEQRIEDLMARVEADVVVLRTPPLWKLSEVRRVLVPVGGRRDQSLLRARLLGSLLRTGEREVTYLELQPRGMAAGQEARQGARREIEALVRDELGGRPARVEVAESDDVAADLVARAAESDLVVFGLRRATSSWRRGRRTFGDLVLRVGRETDSPLLMIAGR